MVRDVLTVEAGADLFRSLSYPPRLLILRHLQIGDHRVTDFIEHLGLSQSTVSWHLARLKEAGLVDSRAEGRASIYSLQHRETVVELLTSAERLLAATGTEAALLPIDDEDAAPAEH